MLKNDQKLISLEELKIPIRQVWRREDENFTPWLKENIHALGEVLGLRLTADEIETPVGDFWLDLLAGTADGKRVVVENQFNRTDHDHLGKCLTYAADFQADIIIWVTEELRDEHRQAVRYFNNTNDKVKFYVVVVEVFKMDESRVAYQFSPFVDSGDWARLHSNSQNTRNQIYAEYHKKLQDELENIGFPLPVSGTWCQGRQINFWFDNAGKIFCYHQVGIDENFYVGVWGENKLIAEELEKQKAEMEKEIGHSLEWDHVASPGDFYTSKIPAPPITDMDSLLPKSVGMLQKFEKFIFPRVRKAMAEIKKREAADTAEKNGAPD